MRVFGPPYRVRRSRELITSAGLAGALQVGGWGWIVLVSAQGLLYIVLSQVAANKGIRFVTTVLAEAVASG